MKKINKLIVFIFIFSFMVITINIPVYGENISNPEELPEEDLLEDEVEDGIPDEQPDEQPQGTNPAQGVGDDWLEAAFEAAGKFLTQEELTDTDIHLNGEENPGIIETILEKFKEIVKALNKILLVVLAGLSTISLAITGVRYILSQGDANRQVVAKNNLHTAFKGMFFGFGAFLIWRIAMSIIQVVITLMAG